MKICLACLVAMSFTACQPKTDDSDPPPPPTPVPRAATPTPPPAPGSWMWNTPKSKQDNPLGIKNDALDQKPRK
jgi:hypothetical protein